MKKYIVTSYIPGSNINEKAYESLNQLAKHISAKLIVYRTKANWIGDEEDDRFVEINGDFPFNKSLSLLDLRLSPSAGDPLSNAHTLVEQDNIILPFPRQDFKTIPRSLKVSKLHKAIWCTGTISEPLYPPNKRGYQCIANHVLGGLVVEVVNDTIFNIRQLEYRKGGIFDIVNNKALLS